MQKACYKLVTALYLLCGQLMQTFTLPLQMLQDSPSQALSDDGAPVSSDDSMRPLPQPPTRYVCVRCSSDPDTSAALFTQAHLGIETDIFRALWHPSRLGSGASRHQFLGLLQLGM